GRQATSGEPRAVRGPLRAAIAGSPPPPQLPAVPLRVSGACRARAAQGAAPAARPVPCDGVRARASLRCREHLPRPDRPVALSRLSAALRGAAPGASGAGRATAGNLQTGSSLYGGQHGVERTFTCLQDLSERG